MKTDSDVRDYGLHNLWSYLQKKPVSIWILIAMLGLGVVLLTSGNPREEHLKERFDQNPVENQISGLNQGSDEERLERELAKTLANIIGIGEVRVDINLRVGNRKIWERKAQISKRVNQDQETVNTEESTSNELVLARDGEGRDLPVLKEELAPIIEGVVVVANGAHVSEIRKLLTDTVTTILGLPSHRVLLIPGK